MKKLFYILVLFILLSCTNYKYEYSVKVIYNNGQSEVLDFSRESFNGNKVDLYLYTPKGGTNQLRLTCGGEEKIITCDVRRYEILSLKKKEI